MKVICIKKIKNFKVGRAYKSELYSGFMHISVIWENNYSPKKSLKIRYSTPIKKSNYQEIKVTKSGETMKTMKVYYDDETHEIFNENEFEEFFVTLKKYRKLKLNKINGNI